MKSILFAVALVVGLVSSSAAGTWTWEATSADVDILVLSVQGQTRSVAVLGPIELPDDWSAKTVVGHADLEVWVDVTEDGGVVDVLPVTAAKPTGGWTAQALAWNDEKRSMRVVGADGAAKILVTDLVRSWMGSEEGQYLVLGALEDRASADLDVMGSPVKGGGVLARLSVHYVEEF